MASPPSFAKFRSAASQTPWLASWSWMPFVYMGFLAVHAATLGPTDDEAYYWVLAQRPALGYAFHPPGVAWLIALFWRIAGGLLAPGSIFAPFLLRLPAVFISGAVLALALQWVGRMGGRRFGWATLALLSLAGIFGLSWMIVPDLPLILGWMLAFTGAWEVCREEPTLPTLGTVWYRIGLGCLMATLGKYSGVLVGLSAGLAVLALAPRKFWWGAGIAIFAGTALAAVPILIWNSQHDWASILYQLHDRHQGASWSLIRYLRFWVIEAALAGPFLIYFTLRLLRGRDRLERFAAIWISVHGVIYLTQPAWAEFKPHWALLVWLPGALVLAARLGQGRGVGGARFQMSWGWTAIFLGALACQMPLISWVGERFTGHRIQPTLDLSNDFRTWDRIPVFLRQHGFAGLPVVGSRYQTASQAAFALGTGAPVELLPRDRKQQDEWPDLGVSDGVGPAWPRLLKPVIFVADFRYASGPEFRGAHCTKQGRLETIVWGYGSRRVEFWECRP